MRLNTIEVHSENDGKQYFHRFVHFSLANGNPSASQTLTNEVSLFAVSRSLGRSDFFAPTVSLCLSLSLSLSSSPLASRRLHTT